MSTPELSLTPMLPEGEAKFLNKLGIHLHTILAR